MMKRFITIMFPCLFCFLPATAGFSAENSIGQIIAIDGQAKIIGADATERALALKSDVFLNDRIVTAAGAKLQIRFNDDTTVSQGEKSEMTIDQYVYNPLEKKDVNCSMKMVKGVFRTITGKITEINPERFKVKTRLATIGVRGCELGFRLQDKREDIYVISLPPGDSIIIEKIIADEAARGEIVGMAGRILTVVNESVAVTISPAGSLVERALLPSESRQLMRDSTPAKAGADANEMVKSGGDSRGSVKKTVDDNLAKNDKTLQGQQLLDQLALVKAKIEAAEQSLQPPPFTAPTTAPYVPPPDRPPPAIPNPGLPWNSWDWGVWADGTVEYKPNAWGYEWLTAADYQNVVAATAGRVLTGIGDAGAVVSAPGYSGTMMGMGGVNFEVEVGTSVTPAWGGTFVLNGSGTDHLNFTVNRASLGGKIDATGKLSLNPLVPLSAYSLTVNGTTYNIGSLGTHSVNGSLIKASPPAAPDISGVTGSFNFQHPGPGVRVSGGFGVDLL